MLCIAGILLSLFGCESAKEHPTSESSAILQNSTAPDATQSDSQGNYTDTVEEKNIPVSLIQAKPFSEGIAWVLYEDQAGDERIGWLHPDGHIDQPSPYDTVAQLNEDDPYWVGLGSNFSGGYSYVKTGDAYVRGASEDPDSFLILNQKGEITAQSPADGSSYDILCGGDGVYLVKQSVRSMTEKEDRYGFISGEGIWIYECALCEIDGNHPLGAVNVGVEPNFIQKEPSCSYLSSGIFCVDYRRTNVDHTLVQKVLYNSNTHQTYRLSNGRIYGNFYDGKYRLVPMGSCL